MSRTQQLVVRQTFTEIGKETIVTQRVHFEEARPIKVVGCVKGGASLRSHWEAGTRPDTARGQIASGSFDFVVLQDIYFVEEAAFQPYARDFHKLINENGAQIGCKIRKRPRC